MKKSGFTPNAAKLNNLKPIESKLARSPTIKEITSTSNFYSTKT